MSLSDCDFGGALEEESLASEVLTASSSSYMTLAMLH